MSSYDLIVIGGGSAGYAGAALAVREGLKVAVVEGGEEVGGLCILKGCMPSKTLIESASRFLTLQRAVEFGLRAENISANPKEILARKRHLIDDFAGYRRSQLESGKFDFIRGNASFLDAHTIEVTGSDGQKQRLESKAFLLATGSELNRIPIPGLEETGYKYSDQLLEWEHIPKSLVVLGAGATGLEFAHYFAALGTKVTIIQRSEQILGGVDTDIATALQQAFEKRGIQILTQTKLCGIEKRGEMKSVCIEHHGAKKIIEAEEIAYALGRCPRLEGLNLERAGVELERGRLKMNPHQQTDVPHIFAAGDVAGPYELVHIAIQQSELAVRNCLRILKGETGLEKIDYRLKLFVTFTHPEVAVIGESERELKKAGRPYKVASYPFNDHGKSMLQGETDGFVKLISDSVTGEILGAAVVGPHASELIHEMAAILYYRGKVADLLQIPHYHPTLSEIWTYPAEELL